MRAWPSWTSKVPWRARPALILGIDALITSCSLWLALLLRFDFALPAETRQALLVNLALLISSRLLAAMQFRLHRWSFRFSGLTDGARIAMAGLFGTGVFTLLVYLLQLEGALGYERLPRSVVVMELLLTTTAMAALRFSPRLALMLHGDFQRARREGTLRTLILGAGSAGEMLLRDLQRSENELYVVGFVDDDPAKRGHVVSGRQVLGARADLAALVARHKIRMLLIAIPQLSAVQVREILSACANLKLRFKILPFSFHDLEKRQATAMLQDLKLQDLLERDEVALASRETGAAVAGRVQLVTGAAGSIGSEVCSQLLASGTRRLVMLDIDESGLFLLRHRFARTHPGAMIVAEVADIRDQARIEMLFRRHRPDDVFHAAARKHVPLMEGAPCEAVKVNVGGLAVVARVAERVGAGRLVFMSTDKAVEPTSVMGATKRLGERYLHWLAHRVSIRISVVRFGNVLGSAGSVVPLFRHQIEAGGPVTVTHPEMRRFFMTISEAVGLVLRAAYGDYGRLYVLDMGQPIRILDLARHMITMAGRVPETDIEIVFSGLRPGEKLHEDLLAGNEREVRRIDRKIRLVEGPQVPEDLGDGIEALLAEAAIEDEAAVLMALRALVPTYGPAAAGKPSTANDPLEDTTASMSVLEV